MKKVFLCLAVFMLVLTVSVFADRTQIEEVFNAYEEIVIEAENMAEMDLLFEESDFIAIDEKATEAQETIAAISEAREWTIEDVRLAMELRVRFNTAMAAAVQKLLKY